MLTFKQRFLRLFLWSIAIFLIMFAFRMIYGFSASTFTEEYTNAGDFFSSVENLRKNYASEKFKESPNTEADANFSSSQKYEKTATVKSKSAAFEKDEAIIKSTTAGFNGVIQYEQNIGNKGNRELHLMIGIVPSKFDTFYIKMQHIGIISSTEITKVDKTTEYRKLNARKSSLEKNLASLNELKSKAGAISDYIALHEKILDIESQLQNLGVELGNFDAGNEFCTIKFSLYEGAAKKPIALISRIKISLEWTIKYYALLVIAFLFTAIGILVLLMIVDKFKLLKIINSGSNSL